MALVEANQIIGLFHGKIDNLVFCRTKEGNVVVRERPKPRKGPFKPGEAASQGGFRLALAYVSRIKREHPELYAIYQGAALRLNKRPCDLANADFRIAPRIQEVDLSAYRGHSGDLIPTEAVVDFGVVEVELLITALDGVEIEQGPAACRASSTWVYQAAVTIPAGQTVVVHVTVMDRPGNVTVRVFHHAIPSA